jgi:hypothetical protein
MIRPSTPRSPFTSRSATSDLREGRPTRGPISGVSLFVCLALLLSPVPPAHAQDKTPVALFNEASELAEEGQLVEAIAIWEMIGDDITDEYRPTVQLNLGLAYRKLDLLPQAAYHFKRHLEFDGQVDPEAITWFEEVQEELSQSHVRHTIRCNPGEALVFVEEGRTAYSCPLIWWFKPGIRKVTVAAEGFDERSRSLEVQTGTNDVVVTVKLEAVARYGILVVKGDSEGAQVFLDGMLEGRIPYKRKLKAGTYDLMVGLPGKPPWKKRVTVEPGKTSVQMPDVARAGTAVERSPVPDEPDKVPEYVPVKIVGNEGAADGAGGWKWGLLGTGLALAAGGGVLQYLATTQASDIEANYPAGTVDDPISNIEVAHYNRDYDEQVRPMEIGGYALYAVGGVAAATSIVLLLMESDEEPADHSPRMSPLSFPGGGGLMMTVDW